MECDIRNIPLPEGFDFPHDATQIGTGLLAPKSESLGGLAPRMPGAAISPQDILDAQHGRKILYVWGWAKYFDVFPNTQEHTTRFCWLIIPGGNPAEYCPTARNGEMGSLVFGYVHNITGNCADEECT